MKYYSEMLDKLFTSEKELLDAEEVKRKEVEKKTAAEKAKKAERAKRAKEVEDALKVANDAQTKAIKLLKDFTKDYGYFHTSFSTDKVDSTNKEKSTVSSFDDFDFFNILTKFLN